MPTTTTRRPTARDALGAIAHLAWATVIVVGAPIALWRFFAWPLPTTVPDWGQVISTPLQLVDPVVILNTFVCLAWMCWAVLMVYVALDVIDATRGVGQRLHRIGPFGVVAAKFVGSLVLLVSLARPSISYASPAAPAPIVQLVDAPSTHVSVDSPVRLTGAPIAASPATTAMPAPTAPTVTSPLYSVQRGDCLWTIAEHQLGSGFRWSEIYDLNRRIIRDPNLIDIGWQLTLPADAQGIVPTPVVADPTPAPEPANPPIESPTPATPNTSANTPAQTDTAPTPGTDGSSQATTTQTADAQLPAPVTTVNHTIAPPPQRAAEGDDRMLPALAQHIPGISGATVLATGILLALRRRRRRRRRHGGPIPPRPVGPLERSVIAAADVPLVRWVGQELAILGELIAGRRHPANPVAIEFSVETGIELLWDRPFPNAPAPWEAVPGAWAWRTLYDPESPVPTAERPALIAGLVTIGTRDGRQVMVNLEALGSIAIIGEAPAVDEFARAIVVELGASDEIADASVCVTCDIAALDGAEHLQKLDIIEPDEALKRIEGAASAARHALDGIDEQSIFAYRTYNTPVLPFEATVVVTSNHDQSLLRGLMDNAQPNMGSAVLIVGDAAEASSRIVLEAGTGRLEPLGLTFTPVGLPSVVEAEVAALLEDDLVASGPPEMTFATAPLRPWWLDTIEGDELHDDAPVDADRTAEPEPADDSNCVIDLTDDGDDPVLEPIPEPRLLIKVLGPPRIVDGPTLGRQELSIVVYVACATKPVRHEHVQDAVWGGDAVSSKRVFNVIGNARTKLGIWDGEPILTTAVRPQSTITVHKDVWTDLELLRRYVAAADLAPSTDALTLLKNALQLIEGPPFDADGFDWANTNQLVSEAESLIERAAMQAVELALDAGDIDLARWAAMQGLRGLPGDELLYRARMRIEDAAGNPTAVRRAYTELVTYLEEYDAEPSDDTTLLYAGLAPTRST